MLIKARIRTVKKIIDLSTNAIKNYGFRYFFNTAILELKQNKFAIFKPEREVITTYDYSRETDYKMWLREHKTTDKKLRVINEEIKNFKIKPKISIILSLGEDIKNYKMLLASLEEQAYKQFEVLIHTEPSIRNDLEAIIDEYKKLKIIFDENNCRAINNLIMISTGEWILFANRINMVTDDALYLIVKTINDDNNAELIYSDEDELETTNRVNPFFKPDWSPDLFLSQDYISSLFAVPKEICDHIKFNDDYRYAAHYDFILRVTDQSRNIKHISHILFSKEKKVQSNLDAESKKALENTIKRRGILAEIEDGRVPNTFRVKYNLKREPKVSIIIPTKDQKMILQRCINSIKNKTKYKNYEIIIVDNNSVTEETKNFLKSLPYKVLTYDKPFNFSKLNNLGRQYATGEFLLFLNDDTAALEPEWLRNMVEIGIQDGVGIVGAKLVLGNGTIQHAGWVYLNTGAGIHPFSGNNSNSDEFHGQINVIRNYSAVTGACLLIKTEIFDKIGGFDDDFDLYYGDSDLCLKVIQSGYRVVYTPYAKLLHQGSTSIKKHSKVFFSTENHCQFLAKWKMVKKGDPFYNPNLKLNYRIKTE